MTILSYLDTVFVLACLAGVVGCGKELPVIPPSTSNSPTAAIPIDASTPDEPVIEVEPETPTYTTIRIPNLDHPSTPCVTIRDWNPATTIVYFPVSPNSTSNYRFDSMGVWIVNASGVAVNAGTHTLGNLFCTITIINGQLIGVVLR